MTDANSVRVQAKREYTQLLRLHERVLGHMTRARDELGATDTDELVKIIKKRTGSAPDLGSIQTSVEEAIRALKLSQAQIQGALDGDPDLSFEIRGIANLPAYLQRFLAERADLPGFDYEIEQDSVRGWILCWKEYAEKDGIRTIRGYGQFCEKPYAWIEE